MFENDSDFFFLEKPPVNLEDAPPHVEPLESSNTDVKVRISGRHIHISPKDLELLYGPGYNLTKYRDLAQPGQYAAKETLTVVGPKGVIEGIRILGPIRDKTQVEISGTDGYHLGMEPPVRDSGNIAGTPGIVLVGPYGAVTLKEGVILAATHIHMSPDDAVKLKLKNGDRVQVLVDGERDLIFTEVLVRVDKSFITEMHVDTDEANAAVIEDGDYVTIIGKILVS
ncbi:phosphate propanoyltransferase [Phosphitispora fastidiosa]|uniref:phosphate propanoyltransferase n=1 Tax=Phosphitispora fastidiosa TaxID=2837202 RepID=UPI001E31823A|nr:phosphate propanoyltransferase [Phosphitispora fastidiosa]MBU7008578.1 putative phosphotransacetylase [Phosphitispora fastidiosa]